MRVFFSWPLLILFKELLIFIYMYECLSACMSIHHVWAWLLNRPEKRIKTPRTGVASACEPRCRCTKLSPGPLVSHLSQIAEFQVQWESARVSKLVGKVIKERHPIWNCGSYTHARTCIHTHNNYIYHTPRPLPLSKNLHCSKSHCVDNQTYIRWNSCWLHLPPSNVFKGKNGQFFLLT